MKEYLNIFNNNDDYANNVDKLPFPNVSYTLREREVHYTPEDSIFNHLEYVDFNLPSGTLWATKNVGAIFDFDEGFFFSWAGTIGSPSEGPSAREFLLEEYEWGDGTSVHADINYSKYNATDGLDKILLADDAARINMGGKWELPTAELFRELLVYVPYEEDVVEGVIGYKFDDGNGNTMFLPSAGKIYTGTYTPSGPYYWCKDLFPFDSGAPCRGIATYANGERIGVSIPGSGANSYRETGMQVRGVVKLNNE